MFEYIDAIRFSEDNPSAMGRATIDASEACFADHFPGLALLPGTMLIELAAQIAGPLAERAVQLQTGQRRWAGLAMIRNAKIHAPCPLPTSLTIRAVASRVEASSVRVETEVRSDEVAYATAELVMTLQVTRDEWRRAASESARRVARWQEAW